ncbi:MAG: PDZ domain-containing protein [Planctomycetota bacterium]
MHRVAAVALLVLVTGCKSNLWKDISDKESANDVVLRQRGFCLGVTVAREALETSIGVTVERVLKESAADQAGIVPGDEIRSVGGRVVRSARDLEAALRSLKARSGDNVGFTGPVPADVIVAFDGQERIVHCKVTPWIDQVKLARERCQTHAKTHESTVSVPFVVDYSRLSIPVGMFRDYFGRSLAEPLLLYRDIDIVPLLGIFSLFRLETTSYREAWRLQLLAWPLKFTSTDDDDEGLNSLLAPGEERFLVL